MVSHPIPFRTRKLSPSGPMVLGPQGPGRVGHCRIKSLLPTDFILWGKIFLYIIILYLYNCEISSPEKSGKYGLISMPYKKM